MQTGNEVTMSKFTVSFENTPCPAMLLAEITIKEGSILFATHPNAAF